MALPSLSFFKTNEDAGTDKIIKNVRSLYDAVTTQQAVTPEQISKVTTQSQKKIPNESQSDRLIQLAAQDAAERASVMITSQEQPRIK